MNHDNQVLIQQIKYTYNVSAIVHKLPDAIAYEALSNLIEALDSIAQSLNIPVRWVGLKGIFAVYRNGSWHLSQSHFIYSEASIDIFRSWYLCLEITLSQRLLDSEGHISEMQYMFRRSASDNKPILDEIAKTLSEIKSVKTDNSVPLSSYMSDVFYCFVQGIGGDTTLMKSFSCFMATLWKTDSTHVSNKH